MSYSINKLYSLLLLSAIVASTLLAESSNTTSLELNEQAVKAVQQKNFSHAEDLFKRALQVDDHNLTAVFNLSGMYLTNNKVNDAIRLLSNYTSSRYQGDAGLFVRLGDAHFANKEIEKACSDYETALKLAPNYVGLNFKLGTVYTLRNNFPAAEQALLAAVAQQPNDIVTISNLANLFLAEGKTESAISTAKRALQIKPSKSVYATLGNAYEIQKDFKNALIAYQRASDLGDNSPELHEKLTTLKRITNNVHGE